MEKENKSSGIKEIARRAGVSIGTVDRVLHNRGEVKADTREKIMAIVVELGYRPNLNARSLSSKKVYRLVALIPQPQILPYWAGPEAGMLQAANEIATYNAQVEMRYFDVREAARYQELLEEVLQSQPDGVLLAPLLKAESEAFLRQCSERGIACVLVDGYLPEADCLAYFGQDARQSGRVAARLMLAGMPQGADVLVVNMRDSKSMNPHAMERAAGFAEFCAHRPDAHKVHRLDIDLGANQGPSEQLAQFFAAHAATKGVFVLNSRVFLAAEFLEQQRLSEVRLIGYDLLPESRAFLRKGVIDVLIGQKPHEQGKQSVLALFEHLSLRTPIKRMNYSPIDIVVNENLDNYLGEL